MSNKLESIFGKSTNRSNATDNGEHWLSVSDLMSGLMMVFLFVSIALMRDAMIERDKIKEVAVAYQQSQVELYDALYNEFEVDLKRWDAYIEKETLSFQFKSPDVLFDTGKITLKPAFKEILADFFPRYLGILMQFKNYIDEVRIEGHTSSVWNIGTSEDDAYFNNMELSQGRTRSVLSYVYAMQSIYDNQSWVKKHIAAVGFSSSRLVVNADGSEDLNRSRRVSFRVITNAETQIRKILDN